MKSKFILLLIIIIIFSSIGILRPSSSSKCIPPKPPSSKDPCDLPKRSTTSPLVFGPMIWTTLHLIAAGYHTPDGTDMTGTAPDIYRINAKKFIESLPFMIPCGDCGFHLHEFIKTRNLNEDTRTKTNFIRFFVDAHNNVTRHVNKIKVDGKLLPPKKLWTVEEAKKRYSCVDTCIKDPRVWPSSSGGLWKHIQKNPSAYKKDMREY